MRLHSTSLRPTHLLKAEKLDDTEVDSGVEAETALVGSQSTAVLHAEAAVDVLLALVVDPGYTERKHALGFNHGLQHTQVVAVLLKERLEAVQNLLKGLQELCLVRVALFDPVKRETEGCEAGVQRVSQQLEEMYPRVAKLREKLKDSSRPAWPVNEREYAADAIFVFVYVLSVLKFLSLYISDGFGRRIFLRTVHIRRPWPCPEIPQCQ
jgi:hypothetical protein